MRTKSEIQKALSQLSRKTKRDDGTVMCAMDAAARNALQWVLEYKTACYPIEDYEYWSRIQRRGGEEIE